MSKRRRFIKNSLAGLALLGFSPVVSGFSLPADTVSGKKDKKFVLRFAVASDGHYGQPGTPYRQDHENMINWLNAAHEKDPLDFIIINGDLVHDRPDLLSEVKKDYYDKLKFPLYAVPGNHDLANAAIWNAVFGYADNSSFQKNGIGFVLANTADIKGTYICPNNNFIKQELEKFKTLAAVFVILHIPPHLWVPENPFVECADTLTLLHSYPNVKAVFHGHDHSLDSVFYTGNLPHFFDAHFGGNWGTSYRGYRIVEVGEGHKINTYQVNASQSPTLNETKL